jgi:hypothetical protein
VWWQLVLWPFNENVVDVSDVTPSVPVAQIHADALALPGVRQALAVAAAAGAQTGGSAAAAEDNDPVDGNVSHCICLKLFIFMF